VKLTSLFNLEVIYLFLSESFLTKSMYLLGIVCLHCQCGLPAHSLCAIAILIITHNSYFPPESQICKGFAWNSLKKIPIKALSRFRSAVSVYHDFFFVNHWNEYHHQFVICQVLDIIKFHGMVNSFPRLVF